MIGERLAETRKNHGDTQNDLANYLHVATATVRSWEQNRSDPSHEMLIAICRHYQVSADFLLGVSNIDPIYEQRRRMDKFTTDELDELKRFEEFLMFKRRE